MGEVDVEELEKLADEWDPSEWELNRNLDEIVEIYLAKNAKELHAKVERALAIGSVSLAFDCWEEEVLLTDMKLNGRVDQFDATESLTLAVATEERFCIVEDREGDPPEEDEHCKPEEK